MKVMQTVSAITNPGMSQEQKLRACWNYITDWRKFNYGGDDPDRSKKGWYRETALKMLSSRTGNCYSFACAFAAMAKEVGYKNIKVIIGYDHCWVTIEREKIYIASADFMTRNTVRRVEVAAPVLDEKLKERLDWMFATMMNDDEKGKRLTETGNYADRNLNDVRLNSQEIFYAMAYSNAEKMQKKEKSEK